MTSPIRGLRFNVERRNYGRHVDVSLYVPMDNGTTQVVTSMNFKHIGSDEAAPDEAPLTLLPSQAQELMDCLWQCGLRPTEGTGSAGSLAATERHLKDMQRIAMGLLRLEGDVP